jgi:hypothetical protein
MMVCDARNYLVFRLCPLSSIKETRTHLMFPSFGEGAGKHLLRPVAVVNINRLFSCLGLLFLWDQTEKVPT